MVTESVIIRRQPNPLLSNKQAGLDIVKSSDVSKNLWRVRSATVMVQLIPIKMIPVAVASTFVQAYSDTPMRVRSNDMKRGKEKTVPLFVSGGSKNFSTANSTTGSTFLRISTVETEMALKAHMDVLRTPAKNMETRLHLAASSHRVHVIARCSTHTSITAAMAI